MWKKLIGISLFLFIISVSVLVIGTILDKQSIKSNAQERNTIQMVPFYPPTATSAPSSLASSSGTISANIQCLVNSVSEAKIKEYMGNLVDNDATPAKDEEQSRWSTFPGNLVEAQYIKSHFEAQGLEAEFQSFPMEGGTSRNIIGRLKGNNQNSFYLITSHMDSREESSHKIAPGADDNASGTVLVMEAARVFKLCNVVPKASLEFITFSGEEQGLLGSQYYVDNKPASKTIQGVINVDMIGNGKSKSCVEFNYKNYNGGDKLSKRVIDMKTKYGITLTTPSEASSNARSDHAPFWAANIPAIYGSECEFSPVYHSMQDTTKYINYAQIKQTTQAVVAAIGSLSIE